LNVAVPWNLSHYIPLGGFDPLYRALFDHAPPDINLVAWDNVRLHRHFADSPADRERVSGLADSYRREIDGFEPGTIARCCASHFYPPDRVLTDALEGDIEFHHSAPFPSLTRPFVFHCESLASALFPNGEARLEKPDELRAHYGALFKHPLCQGIYSHIPETLQDFSRFFADPAIDEKLFNSKIGLSRLGVNPGILPPRRPVDRPRFLFIAPAHEAPADFFDRGGHVVLRFWKEFCGTGRQGTLILRCRRPDNDALTGHGVDCAFIQSEIGRSVVWTEAYASNDDINALMADAHFVLLSGALLQSAFILQAMTHGAVPIVRDAPGASVFVTDRETAIVLQGAGNDALPEIAGSLVAQLVEHVLALLEKPEAWHALSHRISERARTQFSGEKFAAEFWQAVMERARRAGKPASRSSGIIELTRRLRNCTLDYSRMWPRVFESSAQPVRLLDTGTSRIFELGGAVVQISGNELAAHEPTVLADWSVFAPYDNKGAPKMSFANSLVDLEPYLPGAGNRDNALTRHLRNWASNALIPFPGTHSLASQFYHRIRGARTIAHKWVQRLISTPEDRQ
jgi:glycosyltransferase involved in cell wall biosynthesis